MSRQEHATRLAAWMRRCAQEPQLRAYDVLRTILVDTLSAQQREILAFVEDYGDVSSGDIADQFKTSIPNASTVLKQLYEHELIDRSERTDEHGRMFVYSGKFS